jgi:hypothetical protein
VGTGLTVPFFCELVPNEPELEVILVQDLVILAKDPELVKQGQQQIAQHTIPIAKAIIPPIIAAIGKAFF